jgi:hypothetical protein
MFQKTKKFIFLGLLCVLLSSCFELVDTRDGVSGLDHRIFVTKDSFKGNFSGYSSPDDACQAAAQAAGLQRIYRAILSYSTTGGQAKDRLGDSSGYIYIIDNMGAAFVVTKGYLDPGGLWDTSLVNLTTAINMDEYGNLISGAVNVFTGTNADGTKSGSAAADFCNNWKSSSSHTVRFGEASQVDGKWVDYSAGDCSVDAHLYCISQ